jgi:hypothetical protein
MMIINHEGMRMGHPMMMVWMKMRCRPFITMMLMLMARSVRMRMSVINIGMGMLQFICAASGPEQGPCKRCRMNALPVP